MYVWVFFNCSHGKCGSLLGGTSSKMLGTIVRSSLHGWLLAVRWISSSRTVLKLSSPCWLWTRFAHFYGRKLRKSVHFSLKTWSTFFWTFYMFLLPSLKLTVRTWKWMVGILNCPFWTWPVFSCYLSKFHPEGKTLPRFRFRPGLIYILWIYKSQRKPSSPKSCYQKVLSWILRWKYTAEDASSCLYGFT